MGIPCLPLCTTGEIVKDLGKDAVSGLAAEDQGCLKFYSYLSSVLAGNK